MTADNLIARMLPGQIHERGIARAYHALAVDDHEAVGRVLDQSVQQFGFGRSRLRQRWFGRRQAEHEGLPGVGCDLRGTHHYGLAVPRQMNENRRGLAGFTSLFEHALDDFAIGSGEFRQ